jgi:hypothetical protein
MIRLILFFIAVTIMNIAIDSLLHGILNIIMFSFGNSIVLFTFYLFLFDINENQKRE